MTELFRVGFTRIDGMYIPLDKDGNRHPKEVEDLILEGCKLSQRIREDSSRLEEVTELLKEWGRNNPS